MTAAAADPAVLLRRMFWRVGALVVVANGLGAILVFVYLALLSPVPADVTGAERQTIVRENVLVFAPYLVVTGVFAARQARRHIRRITTWAEEGRRPTAAELDRVLRLPLRTIVWPGTVWLLAAVVFGVLQTRYDVASTLVLRVATGILLGGMMTCTLTYLLVERALRPVSALALSFGLPERPRAPGILPRLLISWLLTSALPLLSVGLSQLFRTPAERQELAVPIWFLVVAGLVAGAVAMVTAARSVAEPIAALREGQRVVQSGRLDVTIPVDDASEVGLLQAGFNDMVGGLRERRRLADLFGRHVGEEVARQALERGIALGGEQREVSVLFADVIGSTSLAQALPPDEVVRRLNAFFAAVVECTQAEGGWVNKFAGDGALCVFGTPADHPDHAAAALRAARALRARLAAEGDLEAAVGVSSGLVAAGNVGSAERFEYTVIGDPVNEAARLTDVAKARPSRVLASEQTVRLAGAEGGRWRYDGDELLRGRAEPTRCYVPAA